MHVRHINRIEPDAQQTRCSSGALRKEHATVEQKLSQIPDITGDEPPEKSNDYKDQLISILRSLSPRGFEELCLLLLRENGFENLMLTTRGRDGGIDGISTLRINPFVSFGFYSSANAITAKPPLSENRSGILETRCSAELTKAYSYLKRLRNENFKLYKKQILQDNVSRNVCRGFMGDFSANSEM